MLPMHRVGDIFELKVNSKVPLIIEAEASQIQGNARIMRNISNLGNVNAP